MQPTAASEKRIPDPSTNFAGTRAAAPTRLGLKRWKAKRPIHPRAPEQDAEGGRPSHRGQPQKTSRREPCRQSPPTVLLCRLKPQPRKAHAASQGEHGDVLGIAPAGKHHRGRIQSGNPAGRPGRRAAAQHLVRQHRSRQNAARSKTTSFALHVVSEWPKARKNGIRQ